MVWSGLCLLLGGLRHHVLVFRSMAPARRWSVLGGAVGAGGWCCPALHHDHAGADLSPSAACLRWLDVAGALCRLVFVAMSASSRLFPAGGYRCPRDEHAPPPGNGDNRAKPLVCCWCVRWRLVRLVLLAPVIQSGAGAIGAPCCRGGTWRSRCWCCCRKHYGGARARANRMQTSLNLRARLGAGDHWPDHSGGGRCR